MTDDRDTPNQVPDGVMPPTDDAMFLGGEAAVPPGDYGPPIPSRFPTPMAVAAEVRHLERRIRSRLSPLVPSETPRAVPYQFLWQRYRRFALRGRSEVVDDFGRDPVFAARVEPMLEFLCSRYFRVSTRNVGAVPAKGPAILVANHGGALPFDAIVLSHAMRQHRGRQLRPLIEDALFHAPFLGVFLNRMGAVRACPANAERLLQQNRLVLVFPEGTKGTGKPFKERYKLQRFGRGGFVRLALKTGAPIIPVAVVGAEESSPALSRWSKTAHLLGLPHLPLSPLPSPAKWQLIFGDPMDLRGQYGPDAARDRLLIGELAETIRGQIQVLLEDALRQRKSPFWG